MVMGSWWRGCRATLGGEIEGCIIHGEGKSGGIGEIAGVVVYRDLWSQGRVWEDVEGMRRRQLVGSGVRKGRGCCVHYVYFFFTCVCRH